MFSRRPAQTKSALIILSAWSLCLGLRAWYLYRLSPVGMQPSPALGAFKYSLPSQFPSQGCVWCCAILNDILVSSVKYWASSCGTDALSSYWSLKCNHLAASKPVAGFYQYQLAWCAMIYNPEMLLHQRWGQKLQIQLGNWNASRLLQCF